jgi:hypothetical protein
MTAGTNTPPHQARIAFAAHLTRGRWYVPIAITGVGVALRGPLVAVVAALAASAFVALLWFRSWVWAAAALSVTTLSEILARMGLVPDIVTFTDFVFVYLGVVAVLVRGTWVWTPAARRLTMALALLLLAACLSAILRETEVLRPLVVVGIWAQPFVLVLLFLIEPPSQRDRGRLLLYFGALIILQLPVAVVQAATLGLADPVKGTLTGAHTMAGFTVLGGLTLLSWGYDQSLGTRIACTVGALPFLVLVPVLADAKQVTLSLPAAALVFVMATRRFDRKLMLAALMIGAVTFLLIAVPAGKAAVTFLSEASSGGFSKARGFEVAVQEMKVEWTRAVFGLGPANGLSRMAHLTSDAHALRGSAPLSRLHLAPAPLPAQAVAESRADTSFNIPESSAFGIFTDLGIVGLVAFMTLILTTIAPLMRARRDWLAKAALSGWALSIPLAFTFDWWEQPPFMLPLAMLTGLAITKTATTSGQEAGSRPVVTSEEPGPPGTPPRGVAGRPVR